MMAYGNTVVFNCNTLGYHSICVETIDTYACLDTTCISIRVVQEVFVHIANAFTPNNDDGINEFWAPAMSGIAEMNGYVFNLWGEEVFRFENSNDYWDGRTPQGKRAPSDAYVYKFEMVDFQGETHIYKGHVLLID
jgi:gliding motility-associated-like protein